MKDWQAFLLPAGYSDVLGARISQLVDLDWGNCSEYLHDISSNRAAPKIFSKKTFLCIGAEFVPLHRSKKVLLFIQVVGHTLIIFGRIHLMLNVPKSLLVPCHGSSCAWEHLR